MSAPDNDEPHDADEPASAGLDDASADPSSARPVTSPAAALAGRRTPGLVIPTSPAFRANATLAARAAELTRALNLGISTKIKAAIGPNYKIFPGGFVPPYMNQFTGIAEKINRAMAANWLPALTRLNEIMQALFPPNWGDARPRDWDEFRNILAHEGIPLLWVPGPQAVAAIFEAETPTERRQVIGRRWKGIANDCEKVLGSVTHPVLVHERAFAQDCANALRQGHASAAQALAANLLDSILRRFYTDKHRVELTNNEYKKNGTTFDFSDRGYRAALTFAPVWCAHAKYYPNKGERIPTQYGRHPSAHAVSRAQYTRVNAVIALMVVTSLIKYFDVELKRLDAA
ncbi:hypothetical protein ABT299_30255 [Spirillospora sp. NPDC000708]